MVKPFAEDLDLSYYYFFYIYFFSEPMFKTRRIISLEFEQHYDQVFALSFHFLEREKERIFLYLFLLVMVPSEIQT